MKNFKIIGLLPLIFSLTTIYAQEFDYDRECEIIDGFTYSGDFAGGIVYLEQKIMTFDSLKKDPDSTYSFYIFELGKMYYYTGNITKATKEVERSAQLDKILLGEKSETYLSELSTLIVMYTDLGLYEKSIYIGDQANSLYNQIEITDSLDYAFFLNNMGSLYYNIGNLSMAESYFMKSKILNDKLIEEDHPQKTPLLNNLASIYKKRGQYAKAEIGFLRALEINRKYYGDESTSLGLNYNNLGDLYSSLGNFTEAEKYYTIARRAYEKDRQTSLDYIYTMANLAAIYMFRGEILKAELMIRKSLRIADTLVTKNHDIYITLLTRLANVYNLKEEYQKVIDVLSDCGDILEKMNPHHIELIWNEHNIGKAYSSLHQYDSAETKYKKALSIADAVFEKDHKDYITILCSLAELYYKENNYTEAERLFIESMELFRQNILENFVFMSASEKQKYLAIFNNNINKFNGFAIKYHSSNPAISRKMFDYNLFMKGIILSSSINLKESGIYSNSIEDEHNTYTNWINTREYIGNLYTLPKKEIERRKINIDSVERIANKLEKELSVNAGNFAHHINKSYHFSHQDIRSKLSREEAFIQIIRLPYEDSIAYAVLIISGNNHDDPQLIVLNNGNKLEEEYYQDYFEQITKGYHSHESYDDEEAFLNYWADIEVQIPGIKTVFIIPDGIYNRINLAALKMTNGQFVYEVHNIVTLTSIFDFMDEDVEQSSTNNMAILMGAPDFIHNPATTGDQIAANLNNNSSSYFDYSSLRSSNLNPLPASKDEIFYIDSLLVSRNWQTQLFVSDQATENAIKSIRSPNILHISTHGFFWDLNSDIQRNRKFRPYKQHISTRNPLFSSGLYLAGAQISLNGNFIHDEFSEDGILTAYEVSNLNLDSTQLVVLSACETGLGSIIQNEGVIGLQRAFRIAGAENIIMTLWKVDDRATQVFMNKFYSYWLDGQAKNEAFKSTIEYMRFETKDYTHPFYWGAFVYLGKQAPDNFSWTSWIKVFAPLMIILLVLILAVRKKYLKRLFTSVKP